MPSLISTCTAVFLVRFTHLNHPSVCHRVDVAKRVKAKNYTEINLSQAWREVQVTRRSPSLRFAYMLSLHLAVAQRNLPSLWRPITPEGERHRFRKRDTRLNACLGHDGAPFAEKGESTVVDHNAVSRLGFLFTLCYSSQCCTALYTSLGKHQPPFEGAVPTVVLGRGKRKTRLVAPFYEGCTYPWSE